MTRSTPVVFRRSHTSVQPAHLRAVCGLMAAVVTVMPVAAPSFVTPRVMAQDSAAAIEPTWVVVTKDDTVMRCGSTDQYYKVAEFDAGDLLQQDGRDRGWARVRYPGDLPAVVWPTNGELHGDSTVRLTRRTKLRAQSLILGPAGSWRSLYETPLDAGTELELISIERDNSGEVVGYVVRAPRPPVVESYPHGWVAESALRPATAAEIAAHERELARASGEAEPANTAKPAPKPETKPTATTPATTTPATTTPATSRPASGSSPEDAVTSRPSTQPATRPNTELDSSPLDRPSSQPANQSSTPSTSTTRPSTLPSTRPNPDAVTDLRSPVPDELPTNRPTTRPATTDRPTQRDPVVDLVEEPGAVGVPDTQPAQPSDNRDVNEIASDLRDFANSDAPTQPATTEPRVTPAPAEEPATTSDAVPATEPAQAPAQASESATTDPAESATLTEPTEATEPANTLPVTIEPRTFDELETLFEQTLALPVAEQNDTLDELLAEYRRTHEVTDDELVLNALDQRINWLELRIRLRDKRRELDSALAAADQRRLAIEQRVSEWQSSAGYDIVGRLVPSTVYDGQRLPLMYRVQAVGGGRTLAYMRPDERAGSAAGENAAAYLGRVVGIAGRRSFDPALRLTIIQPDRIDLMRGQP